MTGPGNAASNGSKPDLSQSRFFCNNARKGSLVCGILAFVALVIGGGFSEISKNGARHLSRRTPSGGSSWGRSSSASPSM